MFILCITSGKSKSVFTNAITWVVIFYTDTKSLEKELMKFLVQKGKTPYAWQEALISTSAVSIMYYIRWMKSCFVTMSMQITGCYLIY